MFNLNNLEYKINDLQASHSSSGKDFQFKLSRHDSILSKIEGEHMSMMSAIKDLQIQIQDQNRSTTIRINDVENRVTI